MGGSDPRSGGAWGPLIMAVASVSNVGNGDDFVGLDTAGRLHIDDALMEELKAVKALARPAETLMVADALTGQDAVKIATVFHEHIGITGIVLTRVDGDGRGGAALSMRAVTGQPIKFVGVGEKLGEFEEFYPERIASRILDMGDVVSLVEKAAEMVTQEEAEEALQKLKQALRDMTRPNPPPREVPDALSAQEYWDLALRYKQVGWTEQARDALVMAIECHQGHEDNIRR